LVYGREAFASGGHVASVQVLIGLARLSAGRQAQAGGLV
jgi:hypothetical protein